MESASVSEKLLYTCCCTPAADSGGGFGCEDKQIIFTTREQEILKRIRDAAAEAKSLKARLHGMGPGTPENSVAREEALRELDRLRELRQDLEAQRISAAGERMRILGHE
jgi:hypothetical protein